MFHPRDDTPSPAPVPTDERAPPQEFVSNTLKLNKKKNKKKTLKTGTVRPPPCAAFGHVCVHSILHYSGKNKQTTKEKKEATNKKKKPIVCERERVRFVCIEFDFSSWHEGVVGERSPLPSLSSLVLCWCVQGKAD